MKTSLCLASLLIAVCPGCSHTSNRIITKERHQAAEHTLLADARHLAAACQQYMLESATEKVDFAINPTTGAISGPIMPYVNLITKGTRAVDGTFEIGGSFSLQHLDAFGGNVVTFNDFGEKTQ